MSSVPDGVASLDSPAEPTSGSATPTAPSPAQALTLPREVAETVYRFYIQLYMRSGDRPIGAVLEELLFGDVYLRRTGYCFDETMGFSFVKRVPAYLNAHAYWDAGLSARANFWRIRKPHLLKLPQH